MAAGLSFSWRKSFGPSPSSPVSPSLRFFRVVAVFARSRLCVRIKYNRRICPLGVFRVPFPVFSVFFPFFLEKNPGKVWCFGEVGVPLHPLSGNVRSLGVPLA